MKKRLEPHISTGNDKMGAIPSFSLPSGVTCSALACKTCHKDCYARYMELRFKTVRQSYAWNYDMVTKNMEKCHEWLNWWFDSPNAPRLFRIHVSGDFFSLEYWWMWLHIAKKHPGTKFMAFTKQFDVVIVSAIMGNIPDNLVLIASAWPGVDLPEWVERRLPIAYMQDGTETRIPENAHHCNGDCSGECSAYCWTMKPGDAVYFDKHGPNVRKKKG